MSVVHSNHIGLTPLDDEGGIVFRSQGVGAQAELAWQFEPGDQTIDRLTCSDIAILGAGNAARSLACYLAQQGHVPHMLVRSPHKVSGLMERLRIISTGQLEGEFDIAEVSNDCRSVLGHCRTVFVATTTDAYREIAFRLSPYLTDEHEIVLFSSKFAGVVEFRNVLAMVCDARPRIVETDTIFASRIQADDSIWIRGIKKWTLFSSWNRSETDKTAPLILKFFPALGKAENVVQRGLTDFGALAHPLTMIANMNSVDRNSGFLFYYEGFTERTVVLMERLEDEFRAIAAAYGTSIIPMKDLLNQYYRCNTSSLLEAMRSVPNYSFSQAPGTLNHRFIEEDVASSLVPMQQLALKAALRTPIIDSVINLASALLNRNFAQEGRTLEKLGWAHMSHADIMHFIHA